MVKLTQHLGRRLLDDSLKEYAKLTTPGVGYIREIRNAISMSSYQLAQRMGVSQSTAMKLEESERNSTITLRSLERAAEAMGCRLVYAFVPETSLEALVKTQAQSRAKELANRVFQTMALEAQSTETNSQDEIVRQLAEDLLSRNKRDLWNND